MNARAHTLPITLGFTMAWSTLAVSALSWKGRSQYFAQLFQNCRCVSANVQLGFLPRNNPESVKKMTVCYDLEQLNSSINGNFVSKKTQVSPVKKRSF